jgi:signal transduction histidine kinase
MSLRTKAILIICVALLAVVASLYGTSRFILMNGLSRIEQYETEQSLQRTTNIISNTIADEEADVARRATWDDTYAFIDDGNQAYIDRNLADAAFVNFRVNVILYVDSSGKVVFNKGFDLAAGKETSVPPQLLDGTFRAQLLGNQSAMQASVSGVIVLNEGPMMIASSPILKSDYTGPSQGRLIFGRFLDGAELNRLSQLTLSEVTMSRTDNIVDPNFRSALTSLFNQSIVVKTQSVRTIAGYTLIRDIQGNPGLILRTVLPRDAYLLGQNAVAFYIISVLIIGLIAIVVALSIIQRQILSRFYIILSGLNRIIKTGETSVRLPVSGNDELTLVSRTMNGLLASLEESTAELKAREEKYRLLSEDVQRLYQEEKGLRQALQTEIAKRIEYTRGLVHELKTPITPILAAAELLLEEIREPPLDNLVKSISRSAANLNRRIDELLDMARSEVAMLSVNPEPTDLSILIREIVGEMTPVAQNSDQSLVLEMPQTLPLVDADKDRIRQVLLNLVNNAIKFTPRMGKISVKATWDVANLVVSVSDTGPGMTAEQQEHLFEPYYRVADTRQKLSGLGLGLYLSKSLVELHGGRIWVESEKNHGTTFSFSLPLAVIA